MFPALLSLVLLVPQGVRMAPAGGVEFVVEDVGQGPKVWLGVRFTPVPAPLAAHLGERGVMIANIMKDSPADKAGLEQYDVVIACGDSAIRRPEDLLEALGRVTAGESVKLRIIRKGAERDLEVTPSARPEDGDWKMKYPEPDETLLDDTVRMRGLGLRRGPGGRWEVEELGRLRDLPEELRKFEIYLGPDAPGPDHDIVRRVPPGMGPDVLVVPDEGEHVRVEITVLSDEDGTKTTVRQDADGKIHVTRVDRDGKETAATYDDLKALEKADAEAYRLLRRVWRPGPPHMIRSWLSPERLRELQRDFQVEIEKKLENMHQYLPPAQRRGPEPGEARPEKQGKPKPPAEAKPGGDAEIYVVNVDPQGGIKVVVPKDGGKVTYEFKGRDEFRAAEPELYRKVKDLLP